MFVNYLLTSFRNILHHKGFSIFNILGLALSMSVCMLIITVLLDQFSYDRFHLNKGRIYRIESIDSLASISFNRFASTAYPLADELKNNYAGIEDAVVINNSFNGEGVVNNIRIPFRGLYTTSSFFNVFDFNLKYGSPENILDDPFTVVLTEETARKYFGDENPVGNMLQVDSIGIFKVAGIIGESNKKSHIQFEALASAKSLESFETARNREVTALNWNNYYSNYVYVLLAENQNLNDLQEYLDRVSMEKYTLKEEINISFAIQPLTRIVPGPLLANELGMFLPDFMAVFLVALVIVILLLAAFNFASLSIARSLLRAREVGLRKTIGASRLQIIVQFLFEAVLISVFALVFAFALFQFLLPGFTSMNMMSLLEIRPQQNLMLFVWFILFAIITGLFAGIMPSIFMSAFNPQQVLKGVMNVRLFRRITLRKIFLVTQFVFSMIFIVSIILLMRQMNFMVNAEMGFDRDIVYNINLQGQDFERVKNQFIQLPEVSHVSAASHVPGLGNVSTAHIRLNEEDEKVEGYQFSVDENYLDAMGIELLAGENFPHDMTRDNEIFVLVDESFVKQFNLGTLEQAIGTDIILDDSTLVKIIGIVKDYKYVALFLNPKPLLLRLRPKDYNIAVLRLNSQDMAASVSKMNNIWKEIDPNHELEGNFLDAQIREYYSIFEDVLYTVGYATILIIIIASLGLLGMATYTIQTRIKEIGIRKVFGAYPASVLLSISKSYMWLLLIAAFIAAPIAYMINNLWLQYLAYHVSFGAGTLFIGIMFIVITGFLTVASQTLKASWSNPAEILKYE